jgi:hypothetical protein
MAGETKCISAVKQKKLGTRFVEEVSRDREGGQSSERRQSRVVSIPSGCVIRPGTIQAIRTRHETGQYL